LPASDALLTDRTIRLRLQPGSAWKVNLIYFADDVREKAEALEIKSQESSMRGAPYNMASVETVSFRKEDGNQGKTSNRPVIAAV
jgi:hypothetical protein